MNIQILTSIVWHTKCQLKFFFSSLEYIHIRTSAFRQTRFHFSSLAALTAATPTIKDTVNSQENNMVFFTSNLNDFHDHQTKYSEPFRSLEHNIVFFTSNTILASTPIRQGTVNHFVHLDTINNVMLMAPTSTKHDTVNHCVH